MIKKIWLVILIILFSVSTNATLISTPVYTGTAEGSTTTGHGIYYQKIFEIQKFDPIYGELNAVRAYFTDFSGYVSVSSPIVGRGGGSGFGMILTSGFTTVNPRKTGINSPYITALQANVVNTYIMPKTEFLDSVSRDNGYCLFYQTTCSEPLLAKLFVYPQGTQDNVTEVFASVTGSVRLEYDFNASQYWYDAGSPMVIGLPTISVDEPESITLLMLVLFLLFSSKKYYLAKSCNH